MRRFWLTLVLKVLVALGLMGLAAFAALWLMWGRGLPSVEDVDLLALGGETRVYDRQNRLIGVLTPSLSSGELVSGDILELGEISQPLRKAVVSSEDRRFFEHNGVDLIGVTRGVVKGILFDDLEGGSSITQQLVKNTLLSDLNSARTLERKYKEALLARRVEQNFSKQQILAAYLNVVYWGNTGRRSIVGIDGAAHAYFRKPASELNLAESVYLATLIPAPNARYKKFEEYRPLTRVLLDRMVEDGRVTRAQAEEAWRTPIYPAGWRIGWNDDGTVRSAKLERQSRLEENLPQQAPQVAFHYLQAVERQLVAALGRQTVYGSARIVTGLDLDAQRAAEAAARRAELPQGATLGMAFVDPESGEVRALVGQALDRRRPPDWDNATQARRQVGSSVKPFVYTLALAQGWQQSDTVLDAPLEGPYQPKNYDGRWLGYPVTLRYALDHSLNLPTVRLAAEVGVPKLEEKLRDLGFTVQPDLGLSLSIGTLEASPLQMAAAYAAFANGGLYREPGFVRQVVDRRGEVIYRRPASPARRVWDERTAFLGLDMLRGVVDDLSAAQGGLAVRARIGGWPVGGKTGTTNDVRDLWFAGVTPGLSGAVWVGRQDNQPLPAWSYSGDVAAPLWQSAAAGILAGREPATFPQPPGIEYRVVRRVSMAFLSEEAGGGAVQTTRTDAAPPSPAAPPPLPGSGPASAAPAGLPAPDPADAPPLPGGAESAPEPAPPPVAEPPITEPPVTEPPAPQPDPQAGAFPDVDPGAAVDPFPTPDGWGVPGAGQDGDVVPPTPVWPEVEEQARQAWDDLRQGTGEQLQRELEQGREQLQQEVDRSREELQRELELRREQVPLPPAGGVPAP